MKKAKKVILGLLLTLCLAFIGCGLAPEDPPCSHEWEDWVIITENTCTTGGFKARNCTLCSEVETRIIPASHELQYYEEKAPTCTEIGWEAYESCSRCDYTTYEEISALGHNYVNEVCSNCESHKPTEGLLLELGDDGTYYIVKGIGTAQVADVYIPDEYKGKPVKVIGSSAFSNCDSLTSIEIPDSVTNIGHNAFYGCERLASIVIPSSVTSIGDGAFYTCTSLTSIEIPDSVTRIGPDAFSHCNSLTSVTFGENSRLTSIGSFAFECCTNLTSIEIPDSITSIGSYAFSHCNSLISIEIPESVTSIGDWAFNNCESLTSIEIPNSVTSIGSSAFAYCSSLTNIEVNKDNTNYKSIDGNLYSKDGEILIQYAIGKTATNFIVPSNVTNIGPSAFSGCESLTNIIIPNSVTTIGGFVFSNNDSLTSIVIPGSVMSIGKWAFYSCDNVTIYCEVESQPSGWDSDWNPFNHPVYWKGEWVYVDGVPIPIN